MVELFPNCDRFNVRKKYFQFFKALTQHRKSARHNFELSNHSRLTNLPHLINVSSKITNALKYQVLLN